MSSALPAPSPSPASTSGASHFSRDESSSTTSMDLEREESAVIRGFAEEGCPADEGAATVIA